MFRFEKLSVCQRAIEHADRIYTITRSFPDGERFGLTSQMRRAAVSISSNITEGTGRSSDVEFARFVEIGYSSVMEAVSQATIAKRQGFMTDSAFGQVYLEAEELARMLSGLRSSLIHVSE
ncbi:MAG: four helix bundle protein [Pirellulales bacterium]